MSFYHPHFSFPEDVLPVETAIWWRDNYELFIACLTLPKYRGSMRYSNLSGNLLIYPPKCDIKENMMNGRKPRKPSVGLGDSNAQPVPFRWINIQLTPEDLNTLAEEEADLEQLALAFIELGVRGLGLSVKFDSVRKSYNVSIYGPDTLNNGQPCGISGSAADLRDALLVSLYKFNYGLSSSFDGSSTAHTVLQSERFR